MNKRLYIALLAVCMAFAFKGQDQQYTQFYANPVYLNPAFTGHTAQSRTVLNYRNQWPSIPGAFVSYNFSYEHFLADLNSGFGIIGNTDRAGSGALSTTNVALTYAYEIKLQRHLYLRPGIQFGYGLKSVNYSKLTFGDQLITLGNSSLEYFPDKNISYMDIATGMSLYGRNLWLGASAHHINRPNDALLGEEESFLPIKYSLHGGYRVPITKRVGAKNARAIVYAFNYKMQKKFDQFDVGFYYEFMPMIFGIWYRGIPIVKPNPYDVANQDAVAILLGYEFNEFRFGYSYDITISPLLANTGGSHEISLIYEFSNPINKKYAKRKRVIPCAKF